MKEFNVRDAACQLVRTFGQKILLGWCGKSPMTSYKRMNSNRAIDDRDKRILHQDMGN